MKKYKAVFTDLDGTLLDTIGDLGNSMDMVLAGYGVEGYSADEYKMMVGHGIRVLVERACSGRGITAGDGDVDLFIDVYRKNCTEDTVPYPGVGDMLDGLAENGIPLGIITNKDETLALRITKEILGDGFFTFFRGGRQGVPLKPDPSAVLEEAGRLGLKPCEVLFLGDSGVDMKTAVNAGMYPCGVSWGFRSKDELINSGAREIISNPVDLLGIMD